MTRYGEVVLLLNERQVLIKLDEDWQHLSVGAKVTIFSAVENSALADLGLDKIYSPKGELKITVQQSSEIFLAEVFEEGGRIETRPRANFADIFTEQVVVGASRSAEIDQDDTINLEFDTALAVGDIVGRV